MKVIHPVHVIGAPPIEIPGELFVREEHAVFVPDQEPYGPHRLTIHAPQVSIYGKDDDDCINVSGLVAHSLIPAGQPNQGTQLWRKVVMEVFYPVAR